jgi:hypothetical protein
MLCGNPCDITERNVKCNPKRLPEGKGVLYNPALFSRRKDAMRRFHAVLLLVLAALALAAAGCGGGGGGEKATEEAGAVCDGEALSGETGLPANFPSWDEVTYTFKEQEGPTLVVKGWFDGSLKSAYNEYKGRFEEAKYVILFDELEDKDSEISYKDADGKTTGQLALRDECDNGHIYVRITNRAA